MGAVTVLPMLDEGLGHQAYLVDVGRDRALAVYPTVDLRTRDRAERAASAASVLERRGRQDVSVLLGGPAAWAEATGGAVGSG